MHRHSSTRRLTSLLALTLALAAACEMETHPDKGYGTGPISGGKQDGGAGADAQAGDANAADGGKHGDGSIGNGDAAGGDAGSAHDAGDAMVAIDAGACGGPCTGDKKVCNEASGKCVQCLVKNDCSSISGENECDTATHTCVACINNSQCTSATASRCDLSDHTCKGCEGHADCSQVAGKTACDAAKNECVECTGTKYDACGTAPDSTPYVCDSAARACTTVKEHSVGDCAECVSDVHCALGQICAQQTFGSPAEVVGNFCFWRRASTDVGGPAGNCDVVRPHAKNALNVTSVDGVTVEICTPGLTTCRALTDIGKKCDSAVTPGTPDSAACGFTHSLENYTTHDNQDGFCVDADTNPGSTDFVCTVACNNNDKDCTFGSTCDKMPTPDLCTP